MAPKTLLSLPTETLHDICSLLYDAHKASLACLSLVSKQCCVISTSWLFRHLKIKVHGPKTLMKDLAELLHVLECRNAFTGVHRITLSGTLLPFADDQEEPPIQWKLDNHTWTGHDEIYGTEHFAFSFNPGVSTTSETMEPFWESLVSIIKQAPHLRYVDYNCRNAVPMNIVRALEEHLPSSRLHIEHFRYRTLSNDMQVPKELSLAQSPVLHSIHVRYTLRKSDGQDDYNYEAMLRTIGGITPNLRRVNITSAHAASSPQLHRRRNERRPEWKGFETDLGPTRPAVLESFTYSGSLTRNKLSEFSNVMDFSQLQHLKLSYEITGEAMAYFTHDVRLPHLKDLELSVPPPRPRSRAFQFDDGAMQFDTATFIESLEPLGSLSIRGFLSEAVTAAIFRRHGGRLHSLKLQPDNNTYFRNGALETSCLNLNEYSQLSELCPLLGDLQIPVQRSKSKGLEVECYRLLAKCKALKRLFIELKCDQPYGLRKFYEDSEHPRAIFPAHESLPSGYDSDEVEVDLEHYANTVRNPEQPTARHLRKAFINAALDETLARSIWTLIINEKQGWPLDSLKLYPTGALSFGGTSLTTDFGERTENMCRAYLFERPAHDNAVPEEVRVQELGKRAREAKAARAREHERMMFERHNITPENCGSARLFRTIWPERKEGSIDWRDDWTSYPLQVDVPVDG